jgi:hypothetical protein
MKFDKPIYIGATVLELSKLLMHEFYYKTLHLQPYFGLENIDIWRFCNIRYANYIKTYG